MFSRSLLLIVAGCMNVINAYAQNIVVPYADYNAQNGIVSNLPMNDSQTITSGMEDGSVLVCKANQCIQTNHNMSREYLHNQLIDLVKANMGKYGSVCLADASTHQCVQKGISFPVYSNVIQSQVIIPKVRLIDAKPVGNVSAIDAIIDYRMRAGDTFPRCQTALSRIGTAHAGSVEMMSPRFACRLTETGETIFSIAYHIDYLDFDKGIIGAFYTVDASKALNGSGSGYVLIDFEKGVKMTADETFPYPEQQAALLSGEVETFDTPLEVDAVWMKPTPFLNFPTPMFAPNNCNTFAGGCSAQMLNNPALAVPPQETAQDRLNRLTPPNVPSTIGLIQQEVSYEPITPTERKVITRKKLVSENGEPLYSEVQTQYFSRNTPTDELVEDISKAQKETVGVEPDNLATRVIQNAEKEYAMMKQFEAQQAEKEILLRENEQNQVKAGDAQNINPQMPVVEQVQQKEPVMQQVVSMPKNNQSDDPQRPLGKGVTKTNIEILVPEGVVLSDSERSYIEQLALPPEVAQLQKEEEVVNREIPVVSPELSLSPITEGAPIVFVQNGGIQPLSNGMQVLPQTEQPVMPVAEIQPVEQKEPSFFQKIIHIFD